MLVELNYFQGQHKKQSKNKLSQKMELLYLTGSFTTWFKHLQISKPVAMGFWLRSECISIWYPDATFYTAGASCSAVLRSPSVSQHPENHRQCSMKLCGISESTDRQKNNSASVHDQAKYNFPPNTSFRHVHFNHSIFLVCFNNFTFLKRNQRWDVTKTFVPYFICVFLTFTQCFFFPIWTKMYFIHTTFTNTFLNKLYNFNRCNLYHCNLSVATFTCISQGSLFSIII